MSGPPDAASMDVWTLNRDEVHVWHLPADEDAPPIDHASAHEVLSPAERARHARFMFDADRNRYLVAHVALRRVLGRYAGVSPAALTFETGTHGRPEIVAPAGARRLRFNLSHTRGLIAIAVCLERDVGVDVEWRLRRGSDLLTLADRFFSPVEADAVRREPIQRRADRFFEIWTLKESYIKARGMGLALPLDKFAFDLSRDRPRIDTDPSLGDEPRAWRFRIARPTGEHTLAAAVRAGARDVEFVIRAYAPG
jgi:4'-phosphopantetheinyl transferase